MRRRSSLAILVLLLLVAGCGSGHSSKSSVLVLRAAPTEGQRVTPAAMRSALEVVKRRLRGLGVTSPSASLRGSDEIAVRLTGVRDPARAANVLGRPGVLEMYDFEGDLAPISLKAGAAKPFPSLHALRAAERPRPYVVSGATVRASGSAGGGWYLFRKPPELGPNDFAQRRIGIGFGSATGAPDLGLAFSRHGAMEFQQITNAEYARGRLLAGLHGSLSTLNQQYAQHSAIVLDGVIETMPYIDYTDRSLSLGISTPDVELYEPTRRDASNLAIILRSGPLPFALRRAGG